MLPGHKTVVVFFDVFCKYWYWYLVVAVAVAVAVAEVVVVVVVVVDVVDVVVLLVLIEPIRLFKNSFAGPKSHLSPL